MKSILHTGFMSFNHPTSCELSSNVHRARAEIMAAPRGSVVVFTGGEDIHPSLYGETVTDSYVSMGSMVRDLYEQSLYHEAVRRSDILIVGVCRGHQLLNALRGGTLHQHIDHFSNSHKLTYTSEWFEELYGQERVNTIHHQAIKDLAPGSDVLAIAPDGIIEAVQFDVNMFGFQWHPEFLGHVFLLERLLKKCNMADSMG